MPQEKTFGRYISEGRKRLDLSQKELAKKLKISPQYLNDIEHDRRSPTSADILAQFAAVLAIDLDYLHYLVGKFPEDIKAKNLSEREVGDVLRAFRKSKL